MTEETSPLDVVEAFASAINAHDVDGIFALQSERHVFIDSLGSTVRGAKSLRKAWASYFEMVPDYWVRIDHGVLAPEYIALFGAAGGTLAIAGQLLAENKWEAPAAWRAVVVTGRVAEWQVYADNEPMRALMRKEK